MASSPRCKEASAAGPRVMPFAFRHIGLLAKTDDRQVGPHLAVVASYLEKRVERLWLDHSVAEFLPDRETIDRHQLGRRCDLIIILGGDGSLLAAGRSLVHYRKPIVGINLGRLGFLVDVPLDDQCVVLESILCGKYEVEERFLLRVEIRQRGRLRHRGVAMNEVVLKPRNVSRMIEFETALDGRVINRQRADGLLLATPTGSTAYALSAGGPMLLPTLDAMLLLPICPHTLSSRPLVVNAASVITVRPLLGSNEQGCLICDGQATIALSADETLHIRRMTRRLRLLHPAGYDFFHILRDKLDWG